MVIVDYGVGNYGSIRNMLNRLGCNPLVTHDSEAIASASKIVLAGVGAFDHGMNNLMAKQLHIPLREAVARGVPVLGICLGMQLMLEFSEEGQLPGLGFVPGDVRRFPTGKGLPRVPHMGWNRIAVKKACPLFDGDEDGRRYYFVHSYFVSCHDASDVVATTVHGREFVSAFQRGQLFGVQFHPEKSHRFGMALFKRFLAI